MRDRVCVHVSCMSLNVYGAVCVRVCVRERPGACMVYVCELCVNELQAERACVCMCV